MSRTQTLLALFVIGLLLINTALLIYIALPTGLSPTRPSTVTPIGTLEPVETAAARLYATYGGTLDAVYTEIFTPLPR